MTKLTPNCDLILYEQTDISNTFLAFRMDLCGDTNWVGNDTSNMQKIDTLLGTLLEDGIGLFINNGVTLIPTGFIVTDEVRFNITLTGWTLLAGDSSTTGTATVIIEKISYDDYPSGTWTTVTTTSISTGGKGQGTSFSNATLVAGDIIRARVTAVTTFSKLAVSLNGLRE